MLVKKIIGASFILLQTLIPAFAGGSCTAAPSGCPDTEPVSARLPANSRATVNVTYPSGSQYSNMPTDIQNAINNINSQSSLNGSGVTFALTPNSGTISIVFDTTTTMPPDGSVANFTSTSIGYTIKNGVVTVFLNNQQCTSPQGNQQQQCFNTSDPAGFDSAIQYVITHELYHSLGAGDTVDGSDKSTLMGNFGLANSMSREHVITDCDNAAVKKNASLRKSGAIKACFK